MARPRRRLRVRPGRLLLNLFLLAAGIIFIFPLIWVFFTSFKTDAEIVRATPTLLPKTWTLDNYLGLPSRAPFLRFFVNSLLVSGVSTVFIVFTCTVAGYVFAKYRFPGRNLLFFLVIGTILIPIQTYIVPLYVFVRQLQWLNTYQGMIFPTIIMSSGIFFLRQSIRDIPDDLIEAMRVDGANEFTILFRLIFPLSVASIAAISIVNWVYTWSLFIWPLIVVNQESRFTMEIGLMYFQRQFITEYGGTMAATTLSLLPVLVVFLIFRTQIIEGISYSGVKG